MTEIFGQKATQQDFDLLLQQLQEGTAQANKDPLVAGHIGKEIAAVRQKGKISEADFVHIADESGGVIWESSPGRLTIPEIRGFRSQVTRFGDLAGVLKKYGYSGSTIFSALIQTNPARIETLENILRQQNFQLANLPPDLRNDKHFILALIQRKNEFYTQLYPHEKKDPDFAIQHVRSRIFEEGIFGLRYRESDLFEFVPDALRFDPKFLKECATAVTKDRHNVIRSGNFDYLWFKEGGWPKEPQDPTLLPPQLKNFQFWVDFYDGDKERAFEVAVKGDLVPEAVLKNDYLTRPDASRFYRKLPPQRKSNEDLVRVALAHDPKTALYLSKGSPFLEKPQTWLGLIADPKIRYWNEPRPNFPEQLLDNRDLLNRIVSSHPELLDSCRDQPEKLRKILSQLTPENTIAFVSAYSEVLNLLPDAKQKDLDFAKKVVGFDSHSSAAGKLFRIHGATLAIDAISKNADAISHIPEDVLALPAVDKAIRDQVQTCQENTIPYWAREYFERHPDQLSPLMESKPDWFVQLLAYYHPKDPSKERIPLQLAKKSFSSFINTPERMKIYLDACRGLNSPISDIKEALCCYQGQITHDVSMAAQSATYSAVGGKYENPHPAYPGDIVSLLLNKYHVVPDGLEDGRIMACVTSNDADSLMALLENSHSELSNDGISRVYAAIKSSPERIYEAAKIDPRILQSVSESEWKQLGPSLLKLIDGDLSALALLYPLMPADLRGDKDLALRAVIADSDNYFYLPQSLLQDQVFVTELCGWAAVPAYDLKKMSLTAQSAAIARFPFQFHLLDPQLRRDQNFVQGCLAQNLWLFNELTRAEQAELWPGLKEQLKQRGFVHADVNSWENFVDLLRTKSASPKRIRSLAGWLAAYPDLFSPGRTSATKDDHRVLMVVSKEDWNGAFASVPVVDRLVALGIASIDYREVGSESDVKKIITEAKGKGTTYDEVFIAGHGTQDSLALGGHDRARGETPKIDDETYIDYTDFDASDFDFGSILKSGGQLIDFSCSNGQGAEKEDNLANRFATTLNADQTVVASQVPTNITYMDKDAFGRIQLYWMGNTPYLAKGTRTTPKK